MMKRFDGLYIAAVITAAGRGSRMNMDINKQYIEIGGMPLLARTVAAFHNCNFIKEIILVVNEYEVIYCKQYVVDRFGFDRVKSIISGAGTRQGSVYNGLKEITAGCDIILIHDGARPFIKSDIIADNIAAACEYGAACTAVPVNDTIKTADPGGFIRETLDRDALWAVQTPQTFKFALISEAHKKAAEEGFTGTDDAVLVERMGIKTRFVMGSYDNIKITTRQDLIIAEAIAEAND